jgi:glyoxalase family protein
MHHITIVSSDLDRSDAYYGGVLGLERVAALRTSSNATAAHWYWGRDGGRPGTLISAIEGERGRRPRARMGAGQTHHLALSVADENEQLGWRDRLLGAGYRVSDVRDRVYFKSIYTSDPDGLIVELATAGPGFAVDEPVAALGRQLRLPPWLEQQRAGISAGLRPLRVAEAMMVEDGGVA